jgi:hypothetical protein
VCGVRHDLFWLNLGAWLARHAPNLTALDLQRSFMPPRFLHGLTDLTGFTALDLSGNISLSRMPGAQATLELPATLLMFEMRSCELRGVWRGWAEACPGLTHLDLSGNQFGGLLAGGLSEQLARLPALRSLSLRNANLYAQPIVDVMNAAPTALTRLDLSHNLVGMWNAAEVIAPFYARLVQITALRALSLPDIIGADAAHEAALLGAALRGMPGLTALDRSICALSVADSAALEARGVRIVP